MPNPWTPEQVLELAPDTNSRTNARILASAAAKWRGLQAAQGVVWGQCQGSGADPYRCQVALAGPAFHCSCPSRKVPCKHALALFILFTTQPEKFETSAPPEWVATWLARRAEQEDRRTAAAAAKSAPAPDSTAQARRAAGREKKIRAGIDELEIWLSDLLRQGLATAQSQRHQFWEQAAGRLVDAQAPGLARLVRDMAGICVSGEGWQSRLMDQIARLYLAMEGYRRIESLPSGTQADLRSLAGINTKQEDVLANGETVRDEWLVMGREIEAETGLVSQRVWLRGLLSGRLALLLSFAAPGGTLDASILPGMVVPAELAFYPSAFPLRAVVRTRGPILPLPANLPGCGSFSEAAASYAAALAVYPWLERYPLALAGVTPGRRDDQWVLVDADRRWIPLAKHFLHGWTLLAVSGGAPLWVFGEWNGERLLPLSACSGEQFLVFPPRMEQV